MAKKRSPLHLQFRFKSVFPFLLRCFQENLNQDEGVGPFGGQVLQLRDAVKVAIDGCVGAENNDKGEHLSEVQNRGQSTVCFVDCET